MTEHITHPDGIARLRSVRRDAKDAAVDGLDVLDGLVAFDAEERLAGADGLAVLLQPGDEGAFLHGPAQARNDDLDGHRSLIPPSGREWPGRCRPRAGPPPSPAAGCRASGVKAPFSRRIGASRSSKPASATCAAISAPMPQGANASSTISSRPVFCDRGRIVSVSSGETVRGSISSTEMPSCASCSRGCQRALDHQREGDDGHVACPRGRREPGRTRFRKTPSGTGPFDAINSRCSRNSTGSSQRRARVRRPLAS